MQDSKGHKKKGGRSSVKKMIGKLHLWLGLSSGLIVCFLGITGCILAFEKEIENATQPYRFVTEQHQPVLAPSLLRSIVVKTLPGKKLHSVAYQKGNSAIAIFYDNKPEYYYLIFIDPYTGNVLKVKDMSHDFFRFIINGHFYLWLPPKVGQPIVASATLIFVVLIITGIVLWWPKNKAARKQRFKVKLNAKWRRTNYDLHNVLGFYMSWVIIFIALSGLVMGFQWFANTIYWVSSGGQKQIEFSSPTSDTGNGLNKLALPYDKAWQKSLQKQPGFEGVVEVHFPEDSIAAIEVAMNPDGNTFWKTDYTYYDQNTLKEIPVKHTYGKLKDANGAQKLQRMNYDIHVGAVLGLAGKIMAFCASLLCASMPVTGFLIWRGRKKKNIRKTNTAKVLVAEKA